MLILIFVACTTKIETATLNTGIWRGEIAMQNKTLPFNFEVIKHNENYQITLINGKEKLTLENVKVTKDSVFLQCIFLILM